MSRYTLTKWESYDVDAFPKDIFAKLETKFPPREDGAYIFRPYRVDIVGMKRILSTEAKEVQDFLKTTRQVYTKSISYKIAKMDAQWKNEITCVDAAKDVIEYLTGQDEAYFTERGRNKDEVLNDPVIISEIAAEHLRCVNRYGNERAWSVKDACDIEPGFAVA